MVDSTSDAIIANPQSVISKLFGNFAFSFEVNLDSSSSSGGEDAVPRVSSDFDIPKTFETAFAEADQYEKVYLFFHRLSGICWVNGGRSRDWRDCVRMT